MARFFIDRPIFAIVLAIVIFMSGLIAALNLPIAQYPQIASPRVTVSTSYGGANAEVVEEAVAQIVDQQVNGIEDMISMESTSADSGRYSLDIKFQLGKNVDMAAVQAQNRVGQANAQLPQDVVANGVTTQKVNPDTLMYFSLYSPEGSYDSLFLKNYGSINLVEDLKRVKGVGNVNEYGQEYAMRIWLQPDRMAQLGITTNDVMSAIKSQNIQSPAGTIGQQPAAPEQEHQYTARVKGRLADKDEFARIVVKAKADGSFIRVSDVARVEMGGKDYYVFGDLNGRETATFAIQLSSDANALETADACRAVIAEAAKRFPADLSYKIVVDTTNFVRVSIKEVLITLAEALLLVIFIVFVFLQSWRATLIPMLAVPVSLVGTFAAFLIMGFSINTLTLFAMVLAIGLVVDDAIVVVEAVEHHMRYNKLSPRDATIRAMSEVSGPVVAIAFVLASVFIPVAFFGGTVGVLYKQFALTISVAMGLSAFVALTLTPALCALLLKPHSEDDHKGFVGQFFARFNSWFDKMTERYTDGIRTAIRRTGLCIALLAVLVVLTGTMYRLLPTSFVPSEDQGFFLSAVTLPEASSLSRTRTVANDIGAKLREQPGVQDCIVISGFDLLSGSMKPNSALVITALKPWSQRTTPELHVEQQVRRAFASANIPEAMVLNFNVPALPGVSSVGGMSLMLQDRSGKSLEELDEETKTFLAAARQRPELTAVYSTFRIDTPGYRFDVDREKAQKMGVPVADVFSALQAYFGGTQINDFNRFGRTYKVIMQAETEFRSEADDIRSLFVRSNTGQMVALHTLVKPVPINGPTSIKRFNGFRAVQIGASAAPGYSTGQAIKALEEVAAQTLPATFSYEWAGQSREEKISGGRAPIVFGLAILFVFLCLAALYESWSIPFSVILSVPPAIFGSFLFQYARGLENNVFMQIGLVMLIGLAAKNAILIVEFAKVRVDKGMEPAQAVLEAARIRLRPILMTSLAFIFGCMPLALATGAGAAGRNAMGTAVVGGMFVATLIGIFLIPVLFVAIQRLVNRWKSNKQSVNG